MYLKTRLLLVAPVAYLLGINVFARHRSIELTRQLAEARKSSAFEEVAELLSVCQSANLSMLNEKPGCDGGQEAAGRHVVTVYLNSVPPRDGETTRLTFFVEWIEQHTWTAVRIYDVFCTMCDILACERTASSKKACRGCPNRSSSNLQTDDFSQQRDLELRCADVWNVFCAVANVSLSLTQSERVVPLEDRQLIVNMCELAIKRQVSLWKCGASVPVITVGSSTVYCVDGMYVHCINREALRAAEAQLGRMRSNVHGALQFAQVLLRFCSWRKLIAVAAISLCGPTVLSYLLEPFTWNPAVTLAELARRQANEVCGTPFTSFAKRVLLGYPGKLLAVSAVASTVFQLLTTVQSSLLGGVLAGFKAFVTRDTIMAVSRLDYESGPEWQTWLLAEQGLSELVYLDGYQVDCVFNGLFSFLDAAAASLAYPLETLCGRISRWYICHIVRYLSRLESQQACLEEIELLLTAGKPEPFDTRVEEVRSVQHTFPTNPEETCSLSAGPCEKSSKDYVDLVNQPLMAMNGDGEHSDTAQLSPRGCLESLTPQEHVSLSVDDVEAGASRAENESGKGRGSTKRGGTAQYGLAVLLLAAVSRNCQGSSPQYPAAAVKRQRSSTHDTLGDDVAKSQECPVSSVFARNSSNQTWQILFLHTRLPLSLSCASLAMLAATHALIGATLTWASAFIQLDSNAENYYQLAHQHLDSILGAERSVELLSATSRLPLQDAKSDNNSSNKGDQQRSVSKVYGQLLLANLSDLRLGGWVDTESASFDERFDRSSNCNSRQLLRSVREQFSSVAKSIFGDVLVVLQEVVPPILMVGVATLYPSRLHHLSTAEAASLPDELCGMANAFLPFERLMTLQSGCKCGGQTLQRTSPAVREAFVYCPADYSAYATSVQTLECLCSLKPNIDCRLWEQCEEFTNGPWSVEFRDVSFRYPNSLDFALRNISFSLPKGGFLGVVGYSGAGKSTLLLLLSRVYQPSSGVILLNGKPIERYPVRELRRRIGNVWQECNEMRFMQELSIDGNVALGNLSEANDVSITKALRAAEAWDFVESRGEGRHGSMNPHELSGGELERLNIARSLMKNPSNTGLYMFDECTSAMDSVTEEKIMSRIHTQRNSRVCDDGSRQDSVRSGCQFGESLTAEAGDSSRPPATRIMVSHRLSSIQFADEIIVLSNGCVTERGTWETLLADDSNTDFRKLLSSQMLEAQDTPEQYDRIQT